MKILIATDGSDFSKAAIDEACRMAIRPNDEVLVISCYEDAYPIAAEPFAISAEFYQKFEESMNEFSEGFLASAKEELTQKFPVGVNVSTEVIRGPAPQEIVERADKWGADLIVVGSHGRGFWGRLLGSVSNGVVHNAPCTVLVVKKRIEA